MTRTDMEPGFVSKAALTAELFAKLERNPGRWFHLSDHVTKTGATNKVRRVVALLREYRIDQYYRVTRKQTAVYIRMLPDGTGTDLPPCAGVDRLVG